MDQNVLTQIRAAALDFAIKSGAKGEEAVTIAKQYFEFLVGEIK